MSAKVYWWMFWDTARCMVAFQPRHTDISPHLIHDGPVEVDELDE